MEFNKDYRFDLQLEEGDVGEQLLAAILGLSKIEVKTDYKVSTTGNIAVEYQCRGRKSGINRSEADWWCEVLAGDEFSSDDGRPEVVVVIDRKRLIRILRGLWWEAEHMGGGRLRTVTGGEDGASEIALLPPKYLLLPNSGIPPTKEDA